MLLVTSQSQPFAVITCSHKDSLSDVDCAYREIGNPESPEFWILCVWMHGCDPGRVSDGSRVALHQTLFIEFPSPIFFEHVLYVTVPFLFLSFLPCFCFVLFHALVRAL